MLRGKNCKGKIPDHLIGSRNPKFLINFICGQKLITANTDSLSMRLCKIAAQMISYEYWTHRWLWSFVGHLTMFLVSQTTSNEWTANGRLWIESIWKEALIVLTRYYCRIFWEEERKTTTDRLGYSMSRLRFKMHTKYVYLERCGYIIRLNTWRTGSGWRWVSKFCGAATKGKEAFEPNFDSVSNYAQFIKHKFPNTFLAILHRLDDH
jgi:hypothetical protein